MNREKEIFVSFVMPEEFPDLDDDETTITVAACIGAETNSTTYNGDFVLNLIGNALENLFNTLRLVDQFGIIQVDNPYTDKE